MKKLIFICVLLGPVIWLWAQDIEGTKDHRLFSRIEKFSIYDYSVQDFAAYKLCDENGDNLVVEGKLIYYYYELGDGEVDPKVILNKFSNIAKENGAKIYGDGEHQLYLVLNDGTYTIYGDIYAEDFYYTLNLIERVELKTDISSDDFLNDLRDSGKAVLHFDFKRQECVMTEDCMKIVRMIASVLNKEPTIELSIEAHTDNLGRPDINLELSQKRAENLFRALVDMGVVAERLVHKGYGEENPVADNNTVMGRALNNRIELIKK